MFKKYFKTTLVDDKQIVDYVLIASEAPEGLLEVPEDYLALDIVGLEWDGSKFIQTEPEQEVVEVTNQDLLDVLLEIGEKVGI